MAASPHPTEPLNPDDRSTELITAPPRCRGGHDQPHNPTWHPTLGLVPAATSVVIGALLVVGVLWLEWWLLPALLPWTAGVLAAGLLVSAVAQFWLGHRGMCFVRRTIRWWLGPIGSVLDPIEMG